jgi:hypothetical protein
VKLAIQNAVPVARLRGRVAFGIGVPAITGASTIASPFLMPGVAP